MSESLDRGVVGCERQRARNQAHGAYCIPDTEKLDVHVDRERLLERSALLPAQLVGLGEHLVRERHLLAVARGEESDLMKSASVNDMTFVEERKQTL